MRGLFSLGLVGAVAGCSDATIKTFNAEPTATITSHADDTTVFENTEAELRGVVADTDDATSDLTVSWTLDEEVICADMVPNDSGETSCTTPLTTGPKTIILVVSDPGKATGSDAVSITVDATDPPDVNLVAPYEGEFYRADEPIEFRGTAFDDDDGTSIDVWIDSSMHGRLALDIALDAEGAFTTYGSLGAGDHVITLRAQDSAGKIGEDIHLIEVLAANQAPSITGVTIRPDPAKATDTLRCEYTGFIDPEGDEDASTYEWTINGTGAGTEDTLGSGYVGGDEVACTVTPFDGEDAGEALTATTVILNTAPSVETVEVTPKPAFSSDTLTCTYTGYADIDDDADASTMVWTINEDEAGTGDTLEEGFVAGDAVTCTVTPNDGTEDGFPVADTVVISDSVPGIASVEIAPDPAQASDTLTCYYSGFFDADGGSDLSTYAWEVNGTAAGSDATLAGVFVGGDTVTCTVTPFDGTETGTPLSDDIVIGNTAPEVLSVSLSPTELYTNDTLTATVTTTDGDGDTVSLTYDWYVGVTMVATGTDPTLDGVTHFDKHDSVFVSVTPNDGTEDGIAMPSDVVMVLNSPPTAPGVGISMSSESGRVEIGSIGASATMTPAYLYADIIEATEDAVLDSFEVYGHFTGCSSVDYYVLSSPTATSGTWTIEWENPGQIWDTSPGYNNSGDIDLDVEAGTFYALTYGANCSGGLVFYYGESGLPTDGGFGTVTGYFGQTYDGAASFDGTVTYYGTGGTQGMAVNYSSPGITGDLVCEIDTPSTDDDGDTVTYVFDWDMDGTSFTGADTTTETGDTVPGDVIGLDETWTCTVTPNDGDEDGEAGSASWLVEGPVDDDGDGYTDEEDCDDTDASIHPTAGDTYGDGVDGDCDGLDCEAGWYLDTYFVACYDPRTWDSAETTCQDAGYDGLVSITSEEENTFVADLLPVSGGETPYLYWIGFTDQDAEGSWTWSSGLPVTYTNWNSGEPSDGGLGSEDCGHMYPSWFPVFGRWNDHDCSLGQSYVCELRGDACWDTTFDGSSYTFCDGPKTRVDAESDCLDRGMDLVKIDSTEENDFIWDESVTMGEWGHPGPWIGLQDEDLDGTFAWNDGTSMTYEDWCPSHPIDPGSRAYVHMEIAASDYPCWAANGSSSTAELQYVCEAPPPDEDGDGYTTVDDCDDGDPTIHPMAGDIYEDGIDQDCDGIDCEAAWYGTTYFALCEMSEWEEGADLCDAGGYDFGSVRSADENLFITELMRGSVLFFYPGALVGEAIWLGYSDRAEEDVWVWEDGYTGDYTNWAPGEPNDAGGQDCAYLDTNPDSRDGEWDDANCDIGGDRVILCNAR